MTAKTTADAQTVSVSSQESVKIHAVQTGLVRVRRRQMHGEGPGMLRVPLTFIDREWGEWLPIYAWVIEHPEGLIVVDTGETARTVQPGYFPSWHPYYRRGVEFQVAPPDEIGPQLENLWHHAGDVRTVVLTHLHTDHAGGLHHFPKSEIMIERHDFATASGVVGRLRGYLPNRWPDWLRPTLFEVEPVAFGPFEQSLAVTKAGDVLIVPTPGHTPHHISVVVRTKSVTYFLAGDTSYNQQLMLDGVVDGVAPDARAARETIRCIQELARQEPVVYLPAHDPESARRLEQQEVVTKGNS